MTTALYDTNPAALMRERFAIATSDAGKTFIKALVDYLINPEAAVYHVHMEPFVIYISADPGGHRSDFSLCAYAEFADRREVVRTHSVSLSLIALLCACVCGGGGRFTRA